MRNSEFVAFHHSCIWFEENIYVNKKIIISDMRLTLQQRLPWRVALAEPENLHQPQLKSLQPCPNLHWRCRSSASREWTLLTLQVDEEGAVGQQGVRGQVPGQSAGQGDPGRHHQLSQLGGAGGRLRLQGLEGTAHHINNMFI